MKAYLSIQAKSGLPSQSFIKLTLAIYLLVSQQHFFFSFYTAMLKTNNTYRQERTIYSQDSVPYLKNMFYCWIKYVKSYADKYFSCLNTALLPYLVLSLANCVMSRFDICGDAVRAGLCWSWPLFSANLLFFKGGFNFSYFFGHIWWGYFF